MTLTIMVSTKSNRVVEKIASLDLPRDVAVLWIKEPSLLDKFHTKIGDHGVINLDDIVLPRRERTPGTYVPRPKGKVKANIIDVVSGGDISNDYVDIKEDWTYVIEADEAKQRKHRVMLPGGFDISLSTLTGVTRGLSKMHLLPFYETLVMKKGAVIPAHFRPLDEVLKKIILANIDPLEVAEGQKNSRKQDPMLVRLKRCEPLLDQIPEDLCAVLKTARGDDHSKLSDLLSFYGSLFGTYPFPEIDEEDPNSTQFNLLKPKYPPLDILLTRLGYWHPSSAARLFPHVGQPFSVRNLLLGGAR